MSTGWLHAVRTRRHAIARALVAAWLFPVLLALLPPLSVSAATALERDLAQSVCGQSMPEPGGDAAHNTGHDHCIVAGASCPVCAPSTTAAAPAFVVAPTRLGVIPAFNRDVLPPVRQGLFLSANPPRGPPLPLSV